MYLFIYLFMYASYRCVTGRSFDAKIVKLGWHVRWVSSKMGHVAPTEGPFCGTGTY